MSNGFLTDNDVAVLARQVVDLLAEDAEIRIDPIPSSDPYRWGRGAWIVRPLLERAHPLSMRVESAWTRIEALGFLMRRLAEWVDSTGFYWGVPYPVCPGHQHAAEIVPDGETGDHVNGGTTTPTEGGDDRDGEIRLRCPDTGEIVARIHPAL